MKRFVLIMLSIFTCAIATAATETINWYMDGNTYATTTCQTGADIVLPQTPTKYGYTFNGWNGYTPIEYLESTGTQYIDTGFKPNQDTRVIMGYNIFSDDTADTFSCVLFGARDRIGGNTFFGELYSESNRTYRTDFGSIAQEFYTNSLTPSFYNIKTIVDKNKNSVSVSNINGTLVNITLPTSNFSLPVSITFPAYNNAVGALTMVSSCVIKIYSFQIYDNDVIVRDMIPVLDKNGIPCMYDKVEGKIYYNAGTGQFIAGPQI